MYPAIAAGGSYFHVIFTSYRLVCECSLVPRRHNVNHMALDNLGKHSREGESHFGEGRRPGDVMSLYRDYDRSFAGHQSNFKASGKEPLFVQFENAHMFPRLDGIADLQGNRHSGGIDHSLRAKSGEQSSEHAGRLATREEQLERHRSPAHPHISHQSSHHHHEHHRHGHHHHEHYGHLPRHHKRHHHHHHHHDGGEAGSPDGGKHHKFADGAYDDVKAPDGTVLGASVKTVLQAAKELGLDAKTTKAAVASMLVESKGNPHAIGDGNTSFGLFQLHKGGELTEAHLSPQQAFDPLTNARVALKYFKQQQEHGMSNPGDLAAAAQRPKYRREYAAEVNSYLPTAAALIRKYGGSDGAV